MTENTNQLNQWIQGQVQARPATDFGLSEALRAASIDRFNPGIYPTRKEEEWRYTPLKQVLEQNIGDSTASIIDPELVQKFKGSIPEAHHLVFINGEFSTLHSDSLDLTSILGLTITAIADLDARTRALAEGIIRDSKLSDDNIFLHIALGLSRNGLFIDQTQGVEASTPIHLLNISTQAGSASFSNPVNIIHVGANSRLKVVEQFVSIDDAAAVVIPANFFKLDDGSNLEHYKIGLESDATDHISNTSVNVGNAAEIVSHQYLFGSRLTRSNIEVGFSGPGASAILRGIYLGDKSQHLDVRTYLDHAHPNCSSDQHFRGILNDKARGVFNGLVLVREHAQKTDARQSNKNLLLSRDARVDTKPQLEIFADDVKCAHGATVGELDDDALFYLQSRGIGKADAALMLTRAFAAEISQDITIESVRKYVEATIADSLNGISIANV